MLTIRFQKALKFAARLHGGQTRKGTDVPYVAHLLGVCAIVLEAGGDEDEAIAALLHDAIEDQPMGGRTQRRIGNRFGERVLRIVLACTDNVEGSEERSADNWRARKERYVAHIPELAGDERRVSVADKLYNARAVLNDFRTIGDKVFERFRVSQDETMWYYRALATAFMAGGGPLAEELGRVVAELEDLVTAPVATAAAPVPVPRTNPYALPEAPPQPPPPAPLAPTPARPALTGMSGRPKRLPG